MQAVSETLYLISCVYVLALNNALVYVTASTNPIVMWCSLSILTDYSIGSLT